VAQIQLGTLRVLNGSIPPRALRLVRQWARLHPDELAVDWERAQELDGLFPIEPLRSISGVLSVTEVEPLDDYRLRVSFNDGVVREIDCSFLLHGTLGQALRDPAYFRRARVDPEARTVVWPNGLDPAPEVLRERAARATAERVVGHVAPA
jgi:Protein of unknown function (DUF2442)/Domain of unknown function (DUF4160)